MTYGFRARSGTNVIQIDDQWQTLRYVMGGTATITSVNNSTGYITLPTPIAPVNAPLFAVRSDPARTIRACAHTPSRDSANFASTNPNDPILELRIRIQPGSANPGLSVRWICVDAAPVAASADTHGMVIRNSIGTTVFDSRQRLVLVRDVILVPRGVSAVTARTFNHEACRGTAFYASGSSRPGSAGLGFFSCEPVIYSRPISSSSVEVIMLGQENNSLLPAQVPLIVLDVFD